MMTTATEVKKNTTQNKIPLWIIAYAGLQMLTSCIGIYGGYIDPSSFYAAFPNANWSDPLIKHLAGVWGSKNLGIVVVMLFSIIRRHPRILGAVFMLKFVADTVDILYTNTAFMPETGLVTGLITWLILGLPQAIAAYVLLKNSGLKF